MSVDRRGRGNSEGEFVPLWGDGADGAEVVAWLAAQPFSDGRVAMRGGSYRGMVQWQILAQAPPALATLVPTAAVYPGHDFPNPAGIFLSYTVQWLALTGGHTGNDAWFGDNDFWKRKYLRLYLEHIPFHRLDDLTGSNSAIFHRWLEHPAYDAFWAAHNPAPGAYRSMDVPILTITGYFDGDQPGAMRYYREHMLYAPASARAHHDLLIGPWSHSGTRYPKRELGGFTFGENSVVDLDQLQIDWFDWVLKDGERPELLADRVTYYEMGADVWRHAADLEDLSQDTLRLYLAPGADGAGDVFHSGHLVASPAAGAATASLSHDPLDTSAAEGFLAEEADFYLDHSAALRPGRLVYHSQPLTAATTLCGSIRFVTHLALDVPDADLDVNLYAIEPSGRNVWLANDMKRARFRRGASREVLVEPGKIEKYLFDGFWLTCRRLAKGTRLRLLISPLDTPFLQRNYHSGGKIGWETREDARVATFTVHHDAEHPSYVELPISRRP